MNTQVLQKENRAYADTCGISQNNRILGFVPAFKQLSSGRVELARMQNGSPAPMHMINWLPAEWAASRSVDGTISCLIPGIIAGFVRDGVFYTREQTAGAG